MKHKLTNLFIAALMTACSSAPNQIFPDITKMIPRESEERSIEANVIAPEWTTLTSGVYKESKGKAVFYGLGKVEKQELISDRKMLSEDRARNELAKVFDSYIKRLAKEVTGSKLSNSVTGVHRDRLGSSLNERTATILMEAEITKFWTNENNGKVEPYKTDLKSPTKETHEEFITRLKGQSNSTDAFINRLKGKSSNKN